MPPRRAERPDNDDMVDDNALHASDDQLQGFGGGKRVVVLESDLTRLQDDLAMLQAEVDNRPVSSIIPVNGVIHAGRFELSMTGMTAPEDVTEKELSLFVGFLRSVMKAYQFWAGDLANLYYQLHDMLPAELAALLNVEVRTLEGWARVCSRIPPVTRVTSLDFSHHREVAFLPSKLEGREREILEHAEKFDLSVPDLKAYIRELIRDGKPPRYIPVDTLFSKDRTPGLMQLRRIYREAAKGDKVAREQIKMAIQSYRDWLTDIEKNLNLK